MGRVRGRVVGRSMMGFALGIGREVKKYKGAMAILIS